jgi:hypothetical protein
VVIDRPHCNVPNQPSAHSEPEEKGLAQIDVDNAAEATPFRQISTRNFLRQFQIYFDIRAHVVRSVCFEANSEARDIQRFNFLREDSILTNRTNL